MYSGFDTIPERVCDRQTDRQTGEHLARANAVLNIQGGPN